LLNKPAFGKSSFFYFYDTIGKSATTSRTGGMRKAPKKGHIKQSLVFIDRINSPRLNGQLAGFNGVKIFCPRKTGS